MTPCYLLQKEHLELMPGYMSLHQTPEGLVIKWTPNNLMNGCSTETHIEDKRLGADGILN